jgi:hypothetical protein
MREDSVRHRSWDPATGNPTLSSGLVDDLLHAIAGALIAAAPAATGTPVGACGAAGLVAGLIRELEQMWQDCDFDFGWGRARDVAGWLAGALLAGVLL